MLNSVLSSEEPITLYYKRNVSARKTQLSDEQWTVAREIASVLDPVNEINTRIQGSRDRFLGQTTFLMQELQEVLSSETVEIRSDEVYAAEDTVTTDLSSLHKLTRLAITIACNEMSDRLLGQAVTIVERMAVILDPRYKDKLLFDEQQAEQTRTDLMTEYKKIGGAVTALPLAAASSSNSSSSSSSSSDSNSEPAAKRQKLSVFEKRQRQAEAAEAAAQAAQKAALLTEQLRCEVKLYLEQPLVKDFRNQFDLLQYWKDKGSDKHDSETEPPTLVQKAEFPLLARLARRYFCVDATSCEAERVFSCLALTLDDLRCSLGPVKTEKMMFLRLNKRMIPEFADMRARKAERASQKVNTVERVEQIHNALAASRASASASAAAAPPPAVAAAVASAVVDVSES